MDTSEPGIVCNSSDSKLFQTVCKSEPLDNSIAVQSNYGLNSQEDIEETKIHNTNNNGNYSGGFNGIVEQVHNDESTEADEVHETKDRDYTSSKIRKRIRNCELGYVTKNGKIIKKRKSKKLNNCKKRCGEKISNELRRKCFKEYWDLGTYSKRLSYASKRIQINKNSRITNLLLPKKQRNFTCKYFVIDDDKQNIDICKRCYMHIYDETYGFITSVIKENITGSDLIDFRGQYESYRKISNEQKTFVKSHIKSFPVYESYYATRTRKQLYLAEGLTLTKMFELFQEKYPLSVSYIKYREIFNSLNLKFAKPVSFECPKCIRFNFDINEDLPTINDDLSSLKEHHEDVEISLKTKQEDRANESQTVLFVDLQQGFHTPYLNCSAALYKRKLITFNLQITNYNDKSTHFFFWDETISGSGANQGASCIFKYLTTNSHTFTSHIVIYSDTNIVQHRNSTVATMFQYLMSMNVEFHTVEHKFLEPGHFNCGNGPNVIETIQKSSNFIISHPYDWAQLIRSCDQNKKFNVYNMKIEDFYDFASLQKQYYQEEEPTKWTDIKMLRYGIFTNSSIPYQSSYKYSNNKSIITRKAIDTKFILKQLNYATLPITEEKKADLLCLLQFIPVSFHKYYKKLKTNANMKELCYVEEDSGYD